MNYKVLIPCAGTGSRLKELTKDKNKTLVKVNGRETISYIIEKFPKSIEFVIALGFKGEDVKHFLTSTYKDRKFTFVNVYPFEGHGSSLGFSISCCKDYLQCPFIFIPNDMIVKEPIPVPLWNYIGYASEREIAQFRSVKIKGQVLLDLSEKGITEKGLPYIGLLGVQDYTLFWEALKKDPDDFFKAGESGAIRYMLRNKAMIKVQRFTWFDTGNPVDLKKTEEELSKIRE